MRSENASFDSYAFDDIEHGAHLKIDHSITCKESSMLNLISQPIEKLQAMRAESAAKEDFAYYDAINSARQWENQAAVTRRLERAIEYLNVPETEHTSNKWVKGKDNYDYSKISNRVYTMSYRIYERSSWRSDAKSMMLIGLYIPTARKNTAIYRLQGKKEYVTAEKKPRNTYKAELRHIRIYFLKYPRPFQRNTKSLLWCTVSFCPDMLRRKCRRHGKHRKPSRLKKPLSVSS